MDELEKEAKRAAKILGKIGGIRSAKSRFKGKTEKEISALMRAVRNTNLKN